MTPFDSHFKICVSSVPHSSPDQHIQSSDRFWALGPCGSLWRIICFITWILRKCFSQEEAGPSCEENSSPKSPASPLLAAALQTPRAARTSQKERLVWHRRRGDWNSVAWLCSFSSVQLFSDRGYTAPEEEEKWQEILIHVCPKSSNKLGNW